MVINMSINRLKHYLSLTVDQLFNTLLSELNNIDYITSYSKDYIFSVPESCVEIPILLVAHIDTHYKTPPSIVFHDPKWNVLWSPDGIGGDDRNGVYAIMEIIKTHKCGVLFTDGEEKGGIGAKAFIKDIPVNPGYKMLIEIDRRNSIDCVFYDNESKDFQKFIEDFGFKTATGSYSDISTIGPAWKTNSVNLSAGYYNQHTREEFIVFKQLKNTINKVKTLLSMPIPCFEYKEKTYTAWNDYCYEDYGNHWVGKNMSAKCDYCLKPVYVRTFVNSWLLCKQCIDTHTFICSVCKKRTMHSTQKDPNATVCYKCDDTGSQLALLPS